MRGVCITHLKFGNRTVLEHLLTNLFFRVQGYGVHINRGLLFT